MKAQFAIALTLCSSIAGAQEAKVFRTTAGYGYRDASGKIIVYDYYTRLTDTKNGIGRYEFLQKEGYINAAGKEITRASYDLAYDFSDGMALVNKGAVEDPNSFFGGKTGGKYGYINTAGKEVIALQFESASGFSQGLAAAKQNGKWGYIDKTGKWVIAPQYDMAMDFHEGFAAVNKGAVTRDGMYSGGKWAFVDKTGKTICDFKYTGIESFKEGMAVVEAGGNSVGGGKKCGFINTAGKEVIKPVFDDARSFYNGLAAVNSGAKDGLLGQNGGNWGFIDKTGKEVIPFKYATVTDFGEPVVRAEIGDFSTEKIIVDVMSKKETPREYVLLDNKGKILVPPGKYKYISADLSNNNLVDVHAGLIHVINKADKHGYIDVAGKEAIPPKYDYAYNFENGLAEFETAHKYGLLGSDGREKVPAKYDRIDEFLNGAAIVKLGRGYGLISPNGTELLMPRFDTIHLPHDGIVRIRRGGQYGFASLSDNSKPLAGPFVSAEDFSEGFAKVGDGTKFGFIDNAGKQVVPMTYDDARSFSEGLAPVNIGAKPTKGYGGTMYQSGGKWGFIDRTGKMVIEPKYESTWGFGSSGKASVTLNGKSITIDKTGKEVKE